MATRLGRVPGAAGNQTYPGTTSAQLPLNTNRTAPL